MTLAYACILIAALLPYVWAVAAKLTGDGQYDNRDPRNWLAKQENGRSRRANAAQMNAFEAFPAFAASVLVAQLGGVDARLIGWLALVFVVLRVLHGLLYIANNHRGRSLVWFGGFACVIALFVLALLQGLR